MSVNALPANGLCPIRMWQLNKNADIIFRPRNAVAAKCRGRLHRAKCSPFMKKKEKKEKEKDTYI
ncbi:hypothetical protein NECAME_00957 [Necator americanus]|uniref:Uncharacterized protein n=1 Tax=Necator americanus TaxID=51031 RepID=W2SK26_NECAM|nr:hypothetical protein NECAME_00957 [Necator americanus]ETN70009.1 hypothetical protein NECAME_00957 [Necator americanus]